LEDNVAHEIKKDISRCCSEIAKRWQNCCRIEKSKFLAKNSDWLDQRLLELPAKTESTQ
jgi:hypothetical protein